ncbi:MAG: DUF3108 domain-containing protein [bacterium]
MLKRRPRLRTTTNPPDRPTRSAALLLAAAILLFGPACGHADPLAQPRRLEYRVAWNGIPAAAATVAVTGLDLAGHPGIEVEASARTNAVVDLFWSFRGTATATFLADGVEPLRFIYERTMAGTPYLTSVDFADHQGGARSVSLKGHKRRELALDETGLLDPITAVFRARLSGAKPGDRLRYEIFTGEARYRIQLTVGDAETIDVPAGRFAALRVIPEVWKIGGSAELDQRLRQATIWVAADADRTLLRIRSEVFIGAVTLDLVKIDA